MIPLYNALIFFGVACAANIDFAFIGMLRHFAPPIILDRCLPLAPLPPPVTMFAVLTCFAGASAAF